MSTPTLTKSTLAGSLGDILVDVRAGNRAAAGPAVVVTHGFKGFKDWGMFPPFCERLAKAGFAAVSYNLSGSGVDDGGLFSRPERFRRNTISAEVADLGTVLAALDGGALGVARPASIGLVGHSRGGGISILAAGRSPRVGALVTWSAIASVRRWTEEQVASWRREGALPVTNTRTGETLWLATDVLDDVERNAEGALDIGGTASSLTCPWLLLHGTADETVDCVEARLLAGAAPTTARLVPVEGAGHTFGAVHPFARMTPELELVFDQSIAFLGQYLE